jgi:hypothetical protein
VLGEELRQRSGWAAENRLKTIRDGAVGVRVRDRRARGDPVACGLASDPPRGAGDQITMPARGGPEA